MPAIFIPAKFRLLRPKERDKLLPFPYHQQSFRGLANTSPLKGLPTAAPRSSGFIAAFILSIT